MLLIISLIIAGTALIFLETCLVGGILGVMGAGCFFWAIWQAGTLWGAFGALGIATVCAAAGLSAFLFWLYVIPRTSLGKKIYLTSAENGKSPAEDFAKYKGREGVALTLLLPSGKVEIDSIPFDAKAFTSQQIKKGSRVRVVDTDSFGLIVENIQD